MPPPTVESGLQALGLLRPIDNKTYDFSLADGIKLHLIESAKLCGLKCVLLTMYQEVQTLTKDLIGTRDGVLDIMKTFPPFIRECEDWLRHEISQHCDGLRSNFELTIHDTIKGLITSHHPTTPKVKD